MQPQSRRPSHTRFLIPSLAPGSAHHEPSHGAGLPRDHASQWNQEPDRLGPSSQTAILQGTIPDQRGGKAFLRKRGESGGTLDWPGSSGVLGACGRVRRRGGDRRQEPRVRSAQPASDSGLRTPHADTVTQRNTGDGHQVKESERQN